MVLTRPELIAAFQNEVRILLHLTTKIEPSMLDYRPTPKQRSTLELLRYLTFMGPSLVRAAKAGTFDAGAWTAAEKAADTLTFEQTVAALPAQADEYARLLEGFTDAELREQVSVFGMGPATSRGAFLVTQVLSGCAAYRTQLFLYLKACGRQELSTWNLWVGMDEPATA